MVQLKVASVYKAVPFQIEDLKGHLAALIGQQLQQWVGGVRQKARLFLIASRWKHCSSSASKEV